MQGVIDAPLIDGRGRQSIRAEIPRRMWCVSWCIKIVGRPGFSCELESFVCIIDIAIQSQPAISHTNQYLLLHF